MLAAGRTGNIVLLDKMLHFLLGISVDRPAQINPIFLRIVFDDLVCAKTLLTLLTVH